MFFRTCQKDQQRNKGVVYKVLVGSSVVDNRHGSLETESIFLCFPLAFKFLVTNIYLPISRPKHENQGEVVVDKQGGGLQLSCRQGSLEAASSPIDSPGPPAHKSSPPPTATPHIRRDQMWPRESHLADCRVLLAVKLAYHVLWCDVRWEVDKEQGGKRERERTEEGSFTMSALNMAMNGNAYKMIEIKKVGLSQTNSPNHNFKNMNIRLLKDCR